MSDNFAGIGFMFSGGYFGVDIDDCPDMLNEYLNGGGNPQTNIISEFIDGLASYAELSQSQHGIYIICRGKLPEGNRRKGRVEMYDKGRFFVMTGNYCSEYVDIAECTEKIKPLHSKYLGSGQMKLTENPIKSYQNVTYDIQTIIDKASSSANGDKFRRLFNGDWSGYNSQSEADIALCNMLSFWCNGDTSKIDSIFRSSGLMRDKWDRKQLGSTYGAITIDKAVSNCRNHYGEKYRNDNYSLSFSEKSEHCEVKKGYTFDDTGNSLRLCDKYGDVLKWSYIDRKWLYYKDGKWNYDNLGYVRQLADIVVEGMNGEILHYQQNDEEKGADMEKEFRKHLKKTRSFNGKTNMIKESEHKLSVLPSMFDKYTNLINCKNGILDLRTGRFSEHDKDKYMTKITQCSYNPNAPEPVKWLEFLNDIFAGNAEMIHYIQKVIGYSLTGSTAEQCVFFLYGTGRNGKSTFLEVLRYIMGDYAANIQH